MSRHETKMFISIQITEQPTKRGGKGCIQETFSSAESRECCRGREGEKQVCRNCMRKNYDLRCYLKQHMPCFPVQKPSNAGHPNGRNLSYADFKTAPTTSRKRLYTANILQKQVSASLISKGNSKTQFCCTTEIENEHTDSEEISFHCFM